MDKVQIGDTVQLGRFQFKVYTKKADRVGIGYSDAWGVVHIKWVSYQKLLAVLSKKAV